MLPRLNTCYEFLRSDEVIDRLEFIKWAAKTENDNGLLIAILERMDEIRREGDLDEVLTRREEKTPEPDRYRDKNLLRMLCLLFKDFLEDIFLCGCKRDPYIRDFEWGKLDPVRFVRIYKYLTDLQGHVFNIHEAACLERTSKPRIMARFFHEVSARDISEMEKEQKAEDSMLDWSIVNVFLSILAVATQVIFIVFIITEIISELPDLLDGEDVKLLVSNCVIVVATVTVFLGFVLENYVASKKATRVIQSLRVRRGEYLGERMRRDISLLLNLFGNGLLGYLLFYLNIPFVLSAQSVTDAILNSLATVFLLEIDDRILPLQPAAKVGLDMIDWDNDAVYNNLVKLAHDYLYYKRDHRLPDAVEVTKIFKTFAQTKDEELKLGYSAQDYCRIYVDDWSERAKEHKITVFRLANEHMFPSIYEEIVYKIRGKGAQEFMENVRYFKRIHRDESDLNSEFTRKRVLRVFGKRRTQSTLMAAAKSQKSQNRRYLESFQEDGFDSDISELSDHEVSGGTPGVFHRGKKPEAAAVDYDQNDDPDIEVFSNDGGETKKGDSKKNQSDIEVTSHDGETKKVDSDSKKNDSDANKEDTHSRSEI